MIDFAAIEGFDWDDGNAHKNLDKHGVTQAEAEQVFAGEVLLAEDVAHSQAEVRFQALGETADKRRLHVTFTLRGNGRRVRVISARAMNRKEKAFYEQKAQA
ncbi:MAG TPA: BrnT family toxin [Pseudolabrys sp.]|nr:BrnT family toxin [Pseudolabrys sp.]